jgi:hypothetical protein
MARIENTVFISYRRADVYTALAVYENLKNQGYDVFFDYRSISSGDFEQIISGNIKARAHFLLILSPTALDRCNEPGDWLRREIEIAIDEKRNIIPLFFKGFRFGIPSVSEKLTGKLRNLSRYNGLNIHEDYFDEAMYRLRIQYLNVPLDTVLHPVPTEVQKLVREEQVAADKALEHIVDIKEFIKQPGKRPLQTKELPKPVVIPTVKNETARTIPWRTIVSVGGGLGIALCIVAVAVLISNLPPFMPQPTKTSESAITIQPQNTSTIEPTLTAQPENTITLEPTLTEEPGSPTPPSPTATSYTFISLKVRLENVPFREIDPGSTTYPPYEINATIPRLTGSDDWQVQSFNQSLSNFVTGKVDNYRQEFKSTQSPIGGTSTLDITYILVSQVGDVWSFRFDFAFYFAGAAHPSDESTVLNYDLSQGKQLALSDLFFANSNYLVLISNYCSNKLTDKFGTDGWFTEGAMPTLENYKNWNVRSDGILITFDVYQVAAGAAGPQEVLVPYDEVKSVIEPNGPLLFLYR